VINLKRIAISLITMVMALTVGAYATTAAWSDTVSVTDNEIITGTLDLQVWAYGPEWLNTTDNPDAPLAGLVPGDAPTGVGLEAFRLRYNNANIPLLNLRARINGTTIDPTAGVNKNRLHIQLYNVDDNETYEYTLAQWESGMRAIGTIPNGNVQRHYEMRAWLDSSAGNEWQGQTVEFDWSIEGAQP
jgi:predicted ribosomally synthesized peptide with SipW-like signal peptide